MDSTILYFRNLFAENYPELSGLHKTDHPGISFMDYTDYVLSLLLT